MYVAVSCVMCARPPLRLQDSQTITLQPFFRMQEQHKLQSSTAAAQEAIQRAESEARRHQADVQRMERELRDTAERASRLEQQLAESAMDLLSAREACARLQSAEERRVAEQRRLEEVRLAVGAPVCLHCTAPQCTARGTAWHCTALHAALHCTRHGTALHCTRHGMALHCTALHAALHCTARGTAWHASTSTQALRHAERQLEESSVEMDEMAAMMEDLRAAPRSESDSWAHRVRDLEVSLRHTNGQSDSVRRTCDRNVSADSWP